MTPQSMMMFMAMSAAMQQKTGNDTARKMLEAWVMTSDRIPAPARMMLAVNQAQRFEFEKRQFTKRIRECLEEAKNSGAITVNASATDGELLGFDEPSTKTASTGSACD